MKFSDRTNWRTAPNEITKLKASLEKEGKLILDLTVSNPTQCEFQYLTPELLKPLADAQNLFYKPNARGLPRTGEPEAILGGADDAGAGFETGGSCDDSCPETHWR